MIRTRAWLCAWLALPLLACAAEPTQIVLVVDSDLATPDPLTSIDIEVSSTSTAATRITASLSDPLTPPLPWTLTLFPRGAPGTDVRVTVRARDADGASFLTREVRTSFLPGSSRMLRILLAERCMSVRCPSSQTCDETGCRGVAIPADELESWPGNAPTLDGPACVAREELCDGYDDDCDGLVDETFDVNSDPQHCGACGHACETGACTGGYCSGEAIATLATGGAHTCALREDGRVACWGWNLSGQVGLARPEVLNVPVELATVTSATQLAAGTSFSCGLGADARVSCWGDGARGQLGDGTRTDHAEPAPVMTETRFTAIAAGAQHTCAISTTGEVWCWGSNGSGQVNGTPGAVLATPTLVAGVAGATALACGANHTCAVLMDGSVRCWGANGSGQLGDGTTMRPMEAIVTPPVVGAAALALGRRHSCALLASGAVSCWGANESAQLGDGTTSLSTTPVSVVGLDDATAISAAISGTHVCAVRTGGTLTCWGSNLSGQLGDGTEETRLMPVSPALSGVIAVSAGGMSDEGTGHTCAVDALGAVSCWGDGSLGRLGTPSRSSSASPIAVSGLP